MLTQGKAPFAHPPGGAYNFDIERAAPERILYLESVPKRIRGELGGTIIVDTRGALMLHETGEFIAWYVPIGDVKMDSFEPSGHVEPDPIKGEARYYNVLAENRVFSNAAKTYAQPPNPTSMLSGLITIDFDALDAWYEEDEEIFGHPRDPYHRFDCRRTCEDVSVRVGGVIIAQTRRAIKLFETSISPRYYVPLDDVEPDALRTSETRTYCPYKGGAAYFHVRGGDTTVTDGAWMLPQPLGEAAAVANHVSFWGEGTEVLADGKRTPT